MCASYKNVFEFDIYAKKNGCDKGRQFLAKAKALWKTQENDTTTPVTCVKIVEKNTLDHGENKSTIVLSADTSGTVIAWTLVADQKKTKKKKMDAKS